MNQHYSEADLLETYYTAPGESLPVMLHLADCTDCAARYERLEAKLRGLAACAHAEKPESFWARQRNAVMRRVASADRPAVTARVTRFAAAAALAVAVSATFTWPLLDSRQHEATPPAAVEIAVPDDPWQSESLRQYQPLVEWESWVSEEGAS